MSACIHPLDAQSFVRTEHHPLGPEIDVYICECGRESQRLILNRFTVQDLQAESAARRIRNYASLMLHHAVTAGLIERPEMCERCGQGGQIDGHHYDYSRPLEVEWLCRRCHPQADAERRAAEQEAAA